MNAEHIKLQPFDGVWSLYVMIRAYGKDLFEVSEWLAKFEDHFKAYADDETNEKVIAEHAEKMIRLMKACSQLNLIQTSKMLANITDGSSKSVADGLSAMRFLHTLMQNELDSVQFLYIPSTIEKFHEPMDYFGPLVAAKFVSHRIDWTLN